MNSTICTPDAIKATSLGIECFETVLYISTTMMIYPILVLLLAGIYNITRCRIFIFLEGMLTITGLFWVMFIRCYIIYHGLTFFTLFGYRVGLGPWLPDSCEIMEAAMGTKDVWPCYEAKYARIWESILEVGVWRAVCELHNLWRMALVVTSMSSLVVLPAVAAWRRWMDCTVCGGFRAEGMFMMIMLSPRTWSWRRKACEECRNGQADGGFVTDVKDVV